MDITPAPAPFIPSSLFAYESDAWLSSLTLHIATCRSISSLTVSNLPPRTRAHMVDPITNLPDIEGICDVAEWCLSLVAWRVGLKHITINDLPLRMMDRVGFSLLRFSLLT